MNYTLHQLRIFLDVCETQSITKTAERLYLTQPAVSIQLKKLQDQFEIPLTEIIGRQLYVTDFGREIALSAQRIMDEVEDIRHRTEAFKGELSGKLKLSVVSTGKYVMPYFLHEFISQHPAVDLSMDVTNKTRVIESLQNNEVDFALVSVLPDNLPIKGVELMQNKLYFIGKDNPFDSEEKISPEALGDHPLIYRESGSATRAAMENFVELHDIRVGRRLSLTSNEAVKQAVVAGLGYSLMPLIGIKNEIKDNQLTIIPVEGLPIITNWHLVWLKGKKFSPAAAAYLDFLKEDKKRTIDNHFKWFEEF